MDRKEAFGLAFIIILAAGLRIFLSFQTPFFSLENSYFHIRQADHIVKTGLPFLHDPLSFGGRDVIFSPLFVYLIAFFMKCFSVEIAGKVILNLLAASIGLFVFLVSKQMTGKRYVSLLAAFVSEFIPIYFSYTFNRVSSMSIILPLFVALIYCFLNLKSRLHLYAYIALLVLLSFLTPKVIIFVLGLVFYIILLSIEHIDVRKSEYEVIFFSIFFVLWSQLILYKKLLLAHGPLVVWQNLPSQILYNYFSDITILEVSYKVGEIPFICGLLIAYRYIFSKKDRKTHFLIAFVLSTGLLLWLRLIPVSSGLMFFGVVLILLFAIHYTHYFDFIKSTKLSKLTFLFKVSLIIVLILTSVQPSISLAIKDLRGSVSQQEIDALLWLRDNTQPDDMVFSSIPEGNLITSIAQRQSFIDNNFLFISKVDQRYSDYEKLITTPSKTQAISIFEKYDVDYFYFSQRLKEKYTIEKLKYFDENCFDRVFRNGAADIYKISCRLIKK